MSLRSAVPRLALSIVRPAGAGARADTRPEAPRASAQDTCAAVADAADGSGADARQTEGGGAVIASALAIVAEQAGILGVEIGDVG